MKVRTIGAAALGLAVCLSFTGSAFAQAAADQVFLEVNISTGEVKIVGQNGDPAELASYQIDSTSQSLNSANWNSLADQGQSGFVEFTQSDASVIEGSFGASASVNATGRSLGLLFDTGGAQDLVFLYGEEDAGGVIGSFTGSVSYVPEPAAVGLLGAAGLLFARRRRI